MKKKTGLTIIILLIAAAYFLNPGYSKHMSKLGMSALENEIQTDRFKVGTLTGFLVKYHNYYLFSTTTSNVTGERLTFGILGIVFR
jgi:hypothetical protein